MSAITICWYNRKDAADTLFLGSPESGKKQRLIPIQTTRYSSPNSPVFFCPSDRQR